MRCFARISLAGLVVMAGLFQTGGGPVRAQTGSPQPGTLQLPGSPKRQPTPPGAIAAAPRLPVHRAAAGGSGAAVPAPAPKTATAAPVRLAAKAVPTVAMAKAAPVQVAAKAPPAGPPATPDPAASALPVPPIPPAPPPPVADRATPEETGQTRDAGRQDDVGEETGRKLPRFASLRADEVNLRAGPGTRYPIQWVYKRRDLPLEIEREFEVWRLVRDPDGVRGWVHQATLTSRRTFVVQGADATLRADPKDTASPVAVLRVGVIGRLRSCEAESTWCEVRVGGYRGYLRRNQIWGLLPDEVLK